MDDILLVNDRITALTCKMIYTMLYYVYITLYYILRIYCCIYYISFIHACYVFILFCEYFPFILYTLGATADCPTFVSFWRRKEVVEIDSTSITDDQTTSRNVLVGRFSCNGDLYSEIPFLFPLTDHTHTFPAVKSFGRGSRCLESCRSRIFITDDVHFHSGID